MTLKMEMESEDAVLYLTERQHTVGTSQLPRAKA